MTEPSVSAGVAIVEALLSCGVRHVVLSPGSRSAPLAIAVAAAEAAGDVDLHVRVDERSAGYLALGLAAVTGDPVAVLCTSGTAVANLLPAVVEARYSGVPLVVITADRPPEMRGRGASQTIDQVDVFGRFPLASRDLPAPQGDDWSADPVIQLTELARRGRGPVHLNVPLRPPLVGTLPAARDAPVRGRSSGSGVDNTDGRVTRCDIGEVPARGAILAGDIDVWDHSARGMVLDLAQQCGWPVIAEASSGLLGAPGVVPGGTAGLADARVRQRLRPDFVLSVGPFGLDRGVMAWLRTAGRHVAVRLRPRTDPPDPLAGAEAVLDSIPELHVSDPDPEWSAAWRSLLPEGPGEWSMDAVAAAVWQSLRPEDLLFVASSTAIRSLAAQARGPGPSVLANRGANGIDGLVSTAWGAATAWPGRTVALLGDLALLHDTNGLLVPQAESRPDLTLVVADNNGGGIFGTLEQGAPEYAGTFERVFGTPHDRDLAAILTAHQVPVEVVCDTAGLSGVLAAGSGVRAVVAALPGR